MLKVYVFSLFILFTQNSFARISPLPNDFMPLILVCTNVASGELIAEIYEKDDASKTWAGFIMDNGEPGLISVVRSENGFQTKKGEFNNFRLLQKGDSIYQIALHAANLDGSDGEPMISPVDVTCSSPPEENI